MDKREKGETKGVGGWVESSKLQMGEEEELNLWR